MAKKKTIGTIPQERTPMHEHDPAVRTRNFEEATCGGNPEGTLRKSMHCLMRPDKPCIAGCPWDCRTPPRLSRATKPVLPMGAAALRCRREFPENSA